MSKQVSYTLNWLRIIYGGGFAKKAVVILVTSTAL